MANIADQSTHLRCTCGGRSKSKNLQINPAGPYKVRIVSASLLTFSYFCTKPNLILK